MASMTDLTKLSNVREGERESDDNGHRSSLSTAVTHVKFNLISASS